jgi:hypothetical protein
VVAVGSTVGGTAGGVSHTGTGGGDVGWWLPPPPRCPPPGLPPTTTEPGPEPLCLWPGAWWGLGEPLGDGEVAIRSNELRSDPSWVTMPAIAMPAIARAVPAEYRPRRRCRNVRPPHDGGQRVRSDRRHCRRRRGEVAPAGRGDRQESSRHHLPQPGESAAGVGLDRTDRTPEYVGGLGLCQVTEVAQHDRLTLPARSPANALTRSTRHGKGLLERNDSWAGHRFPEGHRGLHHY